MVNFSGPVLIAESSGYLKGMRAVVCIAGAVLGFLTTQFVVGNLAGEDNDKLDVTKQRILKASVALVAGGAAFYLTRNMPTQPGI